MRRTFPAILGLGAVFALIAVVYFVIPASALVSTIRGELPADWPEAIQALEKNSQTAYVAHGIQENVYEIQLKDRGAFEAAWPHILALKSKGAPITLESNQSYYSVSGTKLEGPGVRIITSSGPGERVQSKYGSWLDVGPEWPEYLKSEDGALPEYVTMTDSALEPKWIASKLGDDAGGFRFRARTDIMLIVDGNIVDLNRIKLPPDTPIIDKRELGDE